MVFVFPAQAARVAVDQDTIVTGAGNENNDYFISNSGSVPGNLKFTAENTAISSFDDSTNQTPGERVLTFTTTDVSNGIHVQASGSRLLINGGSHIIAGTKGTAVFIGGGYDPASSVTAEIQDALIENHSEGGFNGNSAVTANVNSDVTIDRSTLISTTGSGVYAILASSLSLRNSEVISKNAGLDIRLIDLFDNPGSYTIDNSFVTSSDAAAIEISALGGAPDNLQKNTLVISNGSVLTGKDNKIIAMSGALDADVIVNNSQLTGDIDMDPSAGGTARLTLENNASVTGQFTGLSSVALNRGGTWILTQDSVQKEIVMNGGGVSFGDAGAGFKTLEIENLSGSGEFYMNTDITAGQGDYLNVTSRAEGNFLLNVANTGVEPTKTDEGQLKLVHIADGTASFNLKNRFVDIGVWQYELKKQGNDWYLSPELGDGDGDGDGGDRETSPSTDAILSMANVARQVFYGEMEALRTHNQSRGNGMPGENRVWANYLNNNIDQKGDMTSEYRLAQNGVIMGAEHHFDTPFGQAVAGIFAVNSTNSVKHARGGKSHVKSWGAGAYGTLYLPDNYYVDVTMKTNTFSNDLHASMSGGETTSGSFDQTGYGIAAEGGKTFRGTESFWMTPYLRTTWFQASGSGVALDNGMQAEVSGIRSLQGEAGVRAGKDFVGKSIVTPYLTLAVVQEFMTANRVEINDAGFNNDLSGSSVKAGVGINASITDNLKVNSEAKYVRGDKVESPIMASIGLSYSF